MSYINLFKLQLYYWIHPIEHWCAILRPLATKEKT